MKTRNNSITLLLLSLLILQSGLQAAPMSITYQGRLTDGGSPATGVFDLVFQLHSTPSPFIDPVSLRLTNSSVAVTGGLFTVSLDFQPAEEAFVLFDGSERWLEIAVRTNGSVAPHVVLEPRQPITSAPYALKAFGVVGGIDGNQLIAGSVNGSRIQPGTLSSTTLGDGAVTAAKIAGGQVVRSVNGLRDDVSLLAGPGIGLATNAGGLEINALPLASTSWSRAGNADTMPGVNYLGTTDNQPLELRVNGQRALRLEPTISSPNMIGGFSGNFVSNGIVGATIGGGEEHYANADYATIAGGFNNGVSGNYAAIGGGSDNSASGPFATLSGGQLNSASGQISSIGGGAYNNAVGNASTIAGGISNTVTFTSSQSVIGGGYSNYVYGIANTIGGGVNNTIAESSWAVIAGGRENGIGDNDDDYAVIGGGFRNHVIGHYGVVPGGANNAAGHWGFAAGRRAKAVHTGSFVWGDATDADIASANDNSVTFRAAGGVRLFSDASATTGVFLAPGSGSWTAISDRHAKENFQAVESREVLERVARLPMATWNYKSQDAAVRHLGPMAQDFKAAFGVGESDTGISTVDADGVALAAIQGLNQKFEEETQSLREALKARDSEIQTLKEAVGQLKELISSRAKSNPKPNQLTCETVWVRYSSPTSANDH